LSAYQARSAVAAEVDTGVTEGLTEPWGPVAGEGLLAQAETRRLRPRMRRGRADRFMVTPGR
jgi:hypothetical protein